MKIRTRLSILFLISMVLSTFIFTLSTYYLLHSGPFSGVSDNDMHKFAHKAVVQMFGENEKKDEIEIEDCLEKMNQSCDKMQLAVLYGKKWIGRQELSKLSNKRRLLEAVQKDFGNYKIVAEPVKKTNNYVICYVNKEDFEAMTYSFNMPRADGILGKIALFGIMITLVIVSCFFHLFTRKELRRLEEMQKFLTDFALEHTEARLEDNGKDEFSVMAANINAMAEKIESQYKEKLENDRNKQKMIANLSHDVRTPLSSIIGYSEMLMDGVYDSKEEEKRYIDIIHRKAEYMEYLITELLEYSRLQIGNLVLHRTYMNLAELLREILIEYYPVFEKNDYELELEIPENGVYGNWDEQRISRVLRNLIDNALKYGMAGKKLRILLEEKEQEIILEIQDYGDGMSPEETERIFDLFYRADVVRNSKTGGMGLGLYISREIIHLHGGEISVISEPKKGTIMRILLIVE